MDENRDTEDRLVTKREQLQQCLKDCSPVAHRHRHRRRHRHTSPGLTLEVELLNRDRTKKALRYFGRQTKSRMNFDTKLRTFKTFFLALAIGK